MKKHSDSFPVPIFNHAIDIADYILTKPSPVPSTWTFSDGKMAIIFFARITFSVDDG